MLCETHKPCFTSRARGCSRSAARPSSRWARRPSGRTSTRGPRDAPARLQLGRPGRAADAQADGRIPRSRRGDLGGARPRDDLALRVLALRLAPAPAGLRRREARCRRRRHPRLRPAGVQRPHATARISSPARFASNGKITHATPRVRGRLRRLPAAGAPRSRSRSRAVRATTTRRCRARIRPAGAGRARRTPLQRLVEARGLGAHVTAAAADDVEPAWDRSFHRTRDFFRGYRDAQFGHVLYNFGSLDGGVGSVWNAKQAFYVASGMRYVAPFPRSTTGRWRSSGRSSRTSRSTGTTGRSSSRA